MHEDAHELIVFPTELALRRFQQEQALEHGWVDASCHTTFARIRKLCLPYVKLKGRKMSAVQKVLVRRQVVGVARGHFVEGGPLGRLSDRALGEVLEKLVAAMASLPEETERVVDWLLSRSPRNKLYQLGVLFSVWRILLRQEGWVDQIDINQSILYLLKGGRQHWPPLLRDAKQVTFCSVRWFNPFEESCVAALNHKMKIRIESALPPAHFESSADRLGQRIRADIMDRPWAAWAEDLGDALAVDNPEIMQFDDAGRIAFSRSAGAYGEIEDLARRICWLIQNQAVVPNRIALVVPDIGAVQDIIPHVFSRFQIPYYFRRGRPVLSSPCVKAFLAWLAIPLRPERDELIALMHNPAIRFEHREVEVERLLKQPPLIDMGLLPEGSRPAVLSGEAGLKMLKEKLVEPEDHFNREALRAVAETLEDLGKQSLPLNELVDLLEELLENTTVHPGESHEQGVWVLNPHDAVGLAFDVVLFAGLNEGDFPQVPQQDALLSDKERHSLRKHLEEQGRRLPKLTLSESSVLLEQQSVMFLSALGMAHGQIVLSCQAVDQEGNEKSESEFYRKLWNLAGWGTPGGIRLCAYDQWRVEQIPGDGNIFADHLVFQQSDAPEDRVSMPGESFLPVVPLPFCRAKDEALQAAVHGETTSVSSTGFPEQGGAEPVPPLAHLVSMLNIEAERDAFLDTPVDERKPSKYCGHIGALKKHVADWFEKKNELSPTALETLAQCRYVFLLEQVFGLCDPRMVDDMPDPMDRGSLIHSILKEIYAAFAEDRAGIDTPRYWAIKTSDGWRQRTESGADAIPLAVFATELKSEYEAFARKVAEQRLKEVEFGHPGVWAAEREKVLEQVLNIVRHDVKTCAEENRFPALFEMKFGGTSAVDLGMVRLKGRIDRVDLFFDETGKLTRMRVLDYKGAGSMRKKTEEYVDDIRRNLNCQLPIYAFAAQQGLFGEFNTPSVNAMTEAGYMVYQRESKMVSGSLKKSLVSMDEEGLVDGFMTTLLENIWQLKQGDFAVDPLVETYNDWQSVCRTEAVAREELE
jgi:hypothetical protein